MFPELTDFPFTVLTVGIRWFPRQNTETAFRTYVTRVNGIFGEKEVFLVNNMSILAAKNCFKSYKLR